MNPEKQLRQIRNGIYFLCFFSVLTLAASIALNLYLTKKSLNRMQALAVPGYDEHSLNNELNGLLESNQLEALISKCEEIISEKPLSPSGNYYLGLAYYHKGDTQKSREYLAETLRIEPSWAAAITPYLDNL